MRLKLFQVDAFTSRVFGGNPAAVVPLETWLPDSMLQSIALENNLSETAFFVKEGSGWQLRWFTPTQEVDLCGHATVAAAYVLFHNVSPGLQRVEFASRSGPLAVTREEDWLVLDFPSRPPQPFTPPPAIDEILGVSPREVLASRDWVAVFDSEEQVRALKPDLTRLAQMDTFAVAVTAPGKDVDFVSRFFAPRIGVPEDPVTGSAHCSLVPYWSKRLGKTRLTARQVSARGGELRCEDRGDRVHIAGRAVLYLEGQITV